MLRTIGVLKATVLTAALAAGCHEQREASAPTQPPPTYAGQPGYQGQPGYPPPGYQQPGYPPPGYQQPGYPPPGYTPPQQPAPQQPAPQQPAPQQPAPQPTTTPGGFPWPFPFPGQTQQPAPQEPAPQQPAPQQPAPSGGTTAGTATPIDPALASAATIPLNAYAANEAKGMTAEGPPIAGQFSAGQTLEHAFQLLPGKCYTILGVGAGITELDISLIALTPIPMGSPVLAQDNSSGANASLGGRGNCYRWSLPVGINAKFVVKATAGSGVAAAQIYVK